MSINAQNVAITAALVLWDLWSGTYNSVLVPLIMVLVPYFGCPGSLFGPYFVKNWVPISKIEGPYCFAHCERASSRSTQQKTKRYLRVQNFFVRNRDPILDPNFYEIETLKLVVFLTFCVFDSRFFTFSRYYIFRVLLPSFSKGISASIHF